MSPSEGQRALDLANEPSIRDAWSHRPGYLDTAAIGLPPTAAVESLNRRIAEWHDGDAEAPSYDPDVDRCRRLLAGLVGVRSDAVAIVSQASVAAGVVAASLPEGSQILCAEEDFTSVLFPFMNDSRLRVATVPLDDLLDEVDSDVDLVAVSAVQSSDGRVLDLDRLASLSQTHQVRTLLDTTQACGWLPVEASEFDVTVSHAYKWLCSPRGAGFMTVTDTAKEWLRPIAPNWYAGEEPWSSIYGPPLRLAESARRFDLSPPWFSYSAAAEALDVLGSVGVSAINSYSVGLANEFRGRLSLPEADSAIVSLETAAGSSLAAEGIRVSSRAGRVRFSFYLYNDLADVDRAIEVIQAVEQD